MLAAHNDSFFASVWRHVRSIRWHRVLLTLGAVALAFVVVAYILLRPHFEHAAVTHAIEATGGYASYGQVGVNPREASALMGVFGEEYVKAPTYVELRGDADDELLRALAPRIDEVEKLGLSNSQITDEGIKELQRLPKLNSLIIGENDNIQGEGLRYLKDVSSLRLVAMDRRKIGRKHTQALSECTQLTVIQFVDSQISDDALLPLATLSNLFQLNLSGTSINGNGLVILRDMDKLHWLFLGKTNVRDEALVHVAELSNLTMLTLHETQITDAGLAHLAVSKSLTELSLSDTNVGDEGMVHLADLSNLSHLSLSNTKITDAGVKHLAALPNLRYLWLRDTAITDAVVPLLKVMDVEELEIDGTNISEQGRRGLLSSSGVP